MVVPPSYSCDTPDQAVLSNRSWAGLAIVLNGFTPYNVNHCRRVANEIPEMRLHSVFTVKEKLWDVEVPAEINVVHFGDSDKRREQGWAGWRLQDLRTGYRVFDHLRGNNVEVVVLAGYRSLLHLLLLELCYRARIPVFLRSDSNIMSEPKTWRLAAWMKRVLLRWVLRRCAGVMPMGEFGKRYFQKYGADLERCYLVPHEPDYRLFRTVDAAALADFRVRHGLSTDRQYMLSCCRLVPAKRVDLLLDAFVAVADQRPDWDLLLVGKGPLHAELKARVPTRLASRIKWLGFCQVDEVRLVFHASDVFILPSDYEPWAVVVNEAAAAGLVTVASNVVGAAHELVKDGVNGRIFQAGDVRQLTEALLDVTDQERHARYRQQVAPALEAWRKTADPVEGIRKALRSVGVLQREVDH